MAAEKRTIDKNAGNAISLIFILLVEYIKVTDNGPIKSIMFKGHGSKEGNI